MGITVNSKSFSVFGDKAAVVADLAFSGTYAYGGVSLDNDQQFGIHAVDMALAEAKGGYSFEFDKTNKKMKVFGPPTAPPIVFEEKQTIAANSITLNYPAAYIMAITQADSTVKLTTSGATLAAGEAKPAAVFTAGVCPSLTFHSGLSGVVYVTYITQAWKDVWDNVVQEEVQATAAHVATLTNLPIAIQAIRAIGTTSYNACLMDDKDDTVAQGECVIIPAAGTLTFHATDAILSTVVTYIKKPTSGFLVDRFIAEESFTAAANVCTPAYPILLWGYSGQIPENGAVTEVFISLAGSAGAGEAKLDLITAGTKITGHSITTGTGMYVWGRPSEIVTTPLELANGADLSALTSVKALFLGA